MTKSLAHFRHPRSRRNFPGIRLDSDEYVNLVFSRTKTNLILVWGCILIATILALTIFLFAILAQPTLDTFGFTLVFGVLVLILAVAILSGLIAFFIYRGNRLYITNKRFILTSVRFPLVRSEHSTELCDVRDVSFSEDSLVLQLLYHGTLKLATARSVYEPLEKIDQKWYN